MPCSQIRFHVVSTASLVTYRIRKHIDKVEKETGILVPARYDRKHGAISGWQRNKWQFMQKARVPGCRQQWKGRQKKLIYDVLAAMKIKPQETSWQSVYILRGCDLCPLFWFVYVHFCCPFVSFLFVTVSAWYELQDVPALRESISAKSWACNHGGMILCSPVAMCGAMACHVRA